MYPYTDKELSVVELRANGVKPNDIARRLGITPHAVYNRLWRVYQKAGVASAAKMTEWAVRNALDVPLETEPIALRPPAKKRGRKRIAMGRIRRARLAGLKAVGC
jgi:DNA-binding CsgD family transcriptional regulator